MDPLFYYNRYYFLTITILKFRYVCLARRISAISIAERVAQEQCLTSCPSSSSSQKQRGHEEKSGIGSLVGKYSRC